MTTSVAGADHASPSNVLVVVVHLADVTRRDVATVRAVLTVLQLHERHAVADHLDHLAGVAAVFPTMRVLTANNLHARQMSDSGLIARPASEW